MNMTILWAAVGTLAVATLGYLIQFITGGSACAGTPADRKEAAETALRRWSGWLGSAAAFASLLLLTASMIQFVIIYKRLPLATFVETALTMVWGFTAAYLAVEVLVERRLRAGLFFLPVPLLLTIYLVSQNWEMAVPKHLMPALQSYWLQIHVATAMIAYSAFLISFGLAIMILLSDWLPGLAARLPEERSLSGWMSKAVAIGFVFETAMLLTGSVWAQYAWGNYWSWDPKETWALITWLVYAFFLHARVVRGWKGRRLAWTAIVGFAVVLFTWFGVNWLTGWVRIRSLHTY
ncbi:MAG: cytochrome c biogenesis protein CcsA [Chloroflexi bacterium]|nr:cytochrome c biogenesis protein CcsA [Chloroflexota bacterium]